ncbi:MAG: HD domain-containing phosphohydrolase [Planctomycetota bacterium]
MEATLGHFIKPFVQDHPQENILVVDDEEDLLLLLQNALKHINLNATPTRSVKEAKQLLKHASFDLIITDILMPEENGIDLLRWCRTHHIKSSVIMLTGYAELGHVIDALNLGVHTFLLKPFPLSKLLAAVQAALAITRCARVQKEFQEHLSSTNATLRQKVIDAVLEHEALFLGALSALAQTIDARDPYTRQHSSSVASLAKRLTMKMGLSFGDQYIVETAGALHDIGKIAVPEKILLKPGKLTQEEYDVMKMHPLRSAIILKPVPGMEMALPAIRSHHERIDGKGYPDGLKGEAIPLLGRILAVCDTWDAMTSDRPYRHALTLERAVEILREVREKQLSGEMVEVFLELVGKGEIKPSKIESVHTLA